MPGLVRGVARTAVVAGTATAVSNNVSRRQGARWAAKQEQAQAPQQQAYQEPPPPPPPPPAPAPVAGATSTDRIAALKDLADLKAQGILTDAEFEAEKARVLAS